MLIKCTFIYLFTLFFVIYLFIDIFIYLLIYATVFIYVCVNEMFDTIDISSSSSTVIIQVY